MKNVVVRQGKKDDVPAIFKLINELAEYEKALHEVETSVEKLTEDAFGEKPLYGFIVAEVDNAIVGMSVYYYRYSTWKGKRLYLEDILVTEIYRGKGIGTKLFEATARYACAQGCSGINWLVLDWNAPAINFYKKFDVYFEPEWKLAGMNAKALDKFRN